MLSKSEAGLMFVVGGAVFLQGLSTKTRQAVISLLHNVKNYKE